MYLDSVITFGTKEAIKLFIELFGVFVAIFWIIILFNKRSAKKLDKKADVKDVNILECKLLKIEQDINEKIKSFISDNTKSHAEMRAEITMQEQRNLGQHKEIKDEYKLVTDQLQLFIRDRFEDIKDLIKESRHD
jgi:hypothetical protein